jgi:Bacterial conjugation TrbI-like protein
LGEVTQNVKAFGSGKVVIPAGTLVAAFATPNRVRDRIEVKGSWSLIFTKTGKEYEFRGVACDRIYDQVSGHYGLTDGTAGLHGQVFYTDRYAELKAFGAAALGGVAQSFQTVQGNYYGGNNLQHTPENAGLQGLSNVMELMVQKYMNANDGDETYVRVPASKEFYVFTTSVIEPGRASVGAYEQEAKAQTLWEQVKAAKESGQQTAISPELKQMLNDMAQRQSQVEQLKAQAGASPSPTPW